MQAALNPALAAALTLDRAAQVGEFAPVTKEGTPTVVGGLMQKVMPPAVPDVVQQAGLGAQIQDMQMKAAQNAVMNQAMQQAKGPAGLEGLNPEMGNFAEGGIVGYAAGDMAEDEYDRRLLEAQQSGRFRQSILGRAKPKPDQTMSPDERERLLEVIAATAPMMAIPEVAVREDIPPPPPVERQPSAARPSGGVGGIADLFERERAGYRGMKGPATPEEIMAQEQRDAAIQDQYLRSKGLTPTAEMFAARGAEDKSLIDQQRALLRERMEREQGRDTFLGRMGEALRGFSQMQGQGIGSGLIRSYDALARRLASGEARMDQMRDFEIKINELEINRRRALDDARRATAEGDWKRAQQRMGEATAFENAQKKLEASTFGEQAKAVLEERKIAEAAAGRAETAAGRSEQEKSRQMLAAQGRLTEAEKARSAVVEKNKTFLALPKDTKDPMTKQLRETAEREVGQADRNVAEARSLYNSILNQTLGPQASAGVRYAVNQQTGQRIMSTDGGKTWQPAR